MDITWVLVADACSAKIYSVKKAHLINKETATKDELTLVSQHTHPEGHLRDTEMTSDIPGSYGKGRFSSETDPKRHEEDRFASHIAHLLEQARNQNSYRDVILIAPPVFMGLLNKHISHELNKLVSLRIEKDYVNCKERELTGHLQGYL